MTRRRDHNDEETKTGAPTEAEGTIVIKETEGMPLEEKGTTKGAGQTEKREIDLTARAQNPTNA